MFKKSFHCIFLILSGDVSLNPGPVYNSQSSCSNEWNIFKPNGTYLIHLHINSLFPKMDEIQYIAERTDTAVILMSESRLDEIILQSELQIFNYELLRCDRDRAGGGTTCYIRSNEGYVQKHFFPKKIENSLVEILLPKTKPLIVGTINRPSNKVNFFEIINENFDRLDTNIE